jgi:hypothetical protein
MNTKIRWLGTILYFMGMGLTSFNFYPYNLFFMTSGAFFWCRAGWQVNDQPLVLVEGVAFTIYGVGLAMAIYKFVF